MGPRICLARSGTACAPWCLNEEAALTRPGPARLLLNNEIENELCFYL